MAQREIVRERLSLKHCYRSEDCALCVQYDVRRNGLRIDDTAGPNIVLLEKKNHKKSPQPSPNGKFVSVEINVYPSDTSKALNCTPATHYFPVFEKDMETYNRKNKYPIFGRYRVPFWAHEIKNLSSDNSFLQKEPFCGNPNLNLEIGDIILVRLNIPPGTSIDLDKSYVELELVELRGHIGPDLIEVE